MINVDKNSFKLLNKHLKYVQHSLEKNNPTFILLDEIDTEFTLIGGINQTTIETHKNVWNQLCDKVMSTLNIVLICTSNKSLKYFNDLCPSLLRKHRITMILEYQTDKVEKVNFDCEKLCEDAN